MHGTLSGCVNGCDLLALETETMIGMGAAVSSPFSISQRQVPMPFCDIRFDWQWGHI